MWLTILNFPSYPHSGTTNEIYSDIEYEVNWVQWIFSDVLCQLRQKNRQKKVFDKSGWNQNSVTKVWKE